MPWPNFFFRSRKRRDEQPLFAKSAREGGLKTSSTQVPTSAIKPAPIAPESVAGTTTSKSDISTPSSPKEVSVETTQTTPVGEPDVTGTTGTVSGRRKAKLTDLARMVPSPQPSGPELPPEPSSAVTPPAFTVAVPLGSVTQSELAPKSSDSFSANASTSERSVGPAEAKSVESSAVVDSMAKNSDEGKLLPEPIQDGQETEKKEVPPQPDKPTETSATDIPSSSSPAESKPASIPFEHLPAKLPEKKEFLLVNGERILGKVLSETPENIYLEHDTLGVTTIPRSQIAARPVEIILINGDRIVGDIMAETAETLYVRHASLGMLTVPRSQRSTRVVEALLKDGDRILGEVLAETETSTIIRSSTLGTVTVPHNKVAMLNRKVEQVALKSLPSASTVIEDKSSK